MNTEHRYTLDKSSKKHHCPDCGKKRFVRFIDTNTGYYLPEKYGRCDKGDGHYFVNPYTDGYAKMIWEQEQKITGVTKVTVPKQNYFCPKPKPLHTSKPVFFDFDTYKPTLQPERYNQNIFIQNLANKFKQPSEIKKLTNVIELYFLGTIVKGYMSGAVTFPFIDVNGFIRTVQVKKFNQMNKSIGTDFLHSMIEKEFNQKNKPLSVWLKSYINQEKKVSCLFGEHLLNQFPNHLVILVEAPKTAVYGTLYFGLPDATNNLIWLAVYNKSSFSFEKIKVLKGRVVFVFPDLSKDGNTYKEWEIKAKEYENRIPGIKFIFSDLLEKYATEEQKKQGLDLADFL